MKQMLVEYAAFSLWANQQIWATAAKLSEEQLNQPVASSFPSIYKTLLHLWDAEYIWWHRLKLAEKIDRPSEFFQGSFADFLKKAEEQSALWKDWVTKASEPQLQHVFAFIKDKREFKQPVYQMLLHVFNHGSYHRGQLVTMFRQLGVDPIPNTDFLGYARKS